MTKGFQAGMQIHLASGVTEVRFNGLKLNKMTNIKRELKSHASQQTMDFYIRFVIGDLQLDSDSFKIVSSCSQLPKNVKATVRPAKRGKSNDIVC